MVDTRDVYLRCRFCGHLTWLMAAGHCVDCGQAIPDLWKLEPCGVCGLQFAATEDHLATMENPYVVRGHMFRADRPVQRSTWERWAPKARQYLAHLQEQWAALRAPAYGARGCTCEGVSPSEGCEAGMDCTCPFHDCVARAVAAAYPPEAGPTAARDVGGEPWRADQT